jgi:transposase
LAIDISNDTLLRIVRRRRVIEPSAPSAVGVDDWAWRRNHRYGTLICDLDRRKTIALLPDREPATAEAWLRRQPQIAVVARDRAGGYALAARRALPHAVQVADRWHLMENASAAFLAAVRQSMGKIRTAIGATTVNPALDLRREPSILRLSAARGVQQRRHVAGEAGRLNQGDRASHRA